MHFTRYQLSTHFGTRCVTHSFGFEGVIVEVDGRLRSDDVPFSCSRDFDESRDVILYLRHPRNQDKKRKGSASRNKTREQVSQDSPCSLLADRPRTQIAAPAGTSAEKKG